MRQSAPDLNASVAVPAFILAHVNPWFAGVMLATLLVVTIGTGAGLALGISTSVVRDIVVPFAAHAPSDRRVLALSRLLIAAVLAGRRRPPR
jgi:SSS family solute:Na+ symporter